jgi:tRNA(adenine34) deaminase
MTAATWNNAMTLAMAQAELALASGDVPVGAVILDADFNVVATGRNTRELNHDPLGHAEVNAIREAAAKLGDWRLSECTLVVTLEPCVMCAGAIVAARIPRVVFGAWDERAGASGSIYDVLRDARLGNPTEVIAGVLEGECSNQLRQFFETRRTSGSK